MDCGKVCMTESQAKARTHAASCYSRAYYCPGCRSWHTTSEPLAGQNIQYRPLRTRLK